MKFAVFITSGIGNALCLVPLIKTLRQRGSVTCLAASPFSSEEIFKGFDEAVFDEVIRLNAPSALPGLATRMLSRFDVVYLDYFASTRKHLVLARLLGKKVVTNHIPERLPALISRSIVKTEPLPGLHEGIQYLRYADPEASEALLDEQLFHLEPKQAERVLEERYLTIQPGTGNNKAPWKTWPLASWKKLIPHIVAAFPDLHIIVLGDNTETHLTAEFEALAPRVHSLIAKTSLRELPSILARATLHIGSDSALMHIAGCVGTPTVTIWGGSDPQTFGWAKVNAQKHRPVKHTIACHPCNRWIAPNTGRVSDPVLCPDFKCIRSIDDEEVFRAVSDQLITFGHAE